MPDTTVVPKPTETDVKNKPEEQKHLDTDGGERQPSDHSNEPGTSNSPGAGDYSSRA